VADFKPATLKRRGPTRPVPAILFLLWADWARRSQCVTSPLINAGPLLRPLHPGVSLRPCLCSFMPQPWKGPRSGGGQAGLLARARANGAAPAAFLCVRARNPQMPCRLAVFVANYSYLRRTCAEGTRSSSDAQFPAIRLDRRQGLQPHGFVELDFRRAIVSKAMPELLQRVQPHVGAGVATAAVETRTSKNSWPATWAPHLVPGMPGSVSTNEPGGRAGGRAGQQHCLVEPNEVGEIESVGLASGWAINFACGLLQLQPQHGLLAEGFRARLQLPAKEGEFTPHSVGTSDRRFWSGADRNRPLRLAAAHYGARALLLCRSRSLWAFTAAEQVGCS